MVKFRKNHVHHLSLGQKLYIYLFVFIIFPLIFTAVVIHSLASQVITSKTHENVFQSLKQASYTVDNILREVNYLSLSIISDDNLQELISYYNQKSYDDIESTKIKLQNSWSGFSFNSILGSKPYINSISIFKDNIQIYQLGERVQEEDIRFNQIASQLKGKVYWTSLHQLNYLVPNDNHVVSLIRAVNDLESNQQIATERISINEENLSTLYSGINSWSQAKIFIINEQGTVISSSEKDMLNLHLSSKSYIQQILADPNEGTFLTSIDQKDRAIFYCNLNETGWRIVQIIPQSELNKQLYVINTFIYICIAICILFGIFFSFIQHNNIVKPLRLLANEMGKVKNGIFDVHIKVFSKDEIGIVSSIFLNMIYQIKSLIEKVYISQIKEKDAELKALQAQINPHFLYNTLDSIRWLAIKNKDFAVSEQLEILSDLFRHTLNNGHEVTTIGEEIQHLQNYISIQKNRFGDKITFEQKVDPKLYSIKTIKLILQPIVENAIFHGLEPKLGNGKISLEIICSDDMLEFIICDDGIGLDQEKITKMLTKEKGSAGSFALKNIHDRIQLRFGSQFGIQVESQWNQGTHVRITTPIIIEEGDNYEITNRG
jgi:two-component system sensor histidine kinase YesM